MNSSDAAESIVRMTLDGVEVAARITGAGAREIAVMLYTMHKDQKMTKGKTNLSNMLKSGKPLKIFSLKEDDLKKFHREAKRYGVLYTAVTNKKHKLKDGMVDIYVREDDALKVNRIVDKFKLSVVDIAGIQSEIQKDKVEEILKDAKERGGKIKSNEEKLADEIMSNSLRKEENINPYVAKTEKSPQSKPLLENKKNSGVTSKLKKSVKEALREIKNEMKYQSADEKTKKVLREGNEVVAPNKKTMKTIHYYPRKRDLKKKAKGR